MNDIKVTVFTPTYNRAYIIGELFQSLKAQSCFDFEWLVIDDGSTDNTKEIFADIQKEKVLFPVTYIQKANGGKHRAINDAVKIAKGNMFFIVDSDDRVTPDAIEKIISWSTSIAELEGYAGVSGNRGTDKNTIIGSTFDGEWIDGTSLERSNNNILGDKAEVFYTSILKKYPFPEFEGENFIGESIVWNKIAEDNLKIRWFNDVIYLCQYREDGLTRNLDEINKKNPQGCAANLLQTIKHSNYKTRDRINAFYTYYSTVSREYGLRVSSKYLHIPVLYMAYVVARCRIRDILRKKV